MDNDRIKRARDLKNPSGDATGPTHVGGADLKGTKLGGIHRRTGAANRDEHKQR